MTLQEARDFIRSTTPNDYPQDRFVHSAHVDLYNAAGEAEQRRMAADAVAHMALAPAALVHDDDDGGGWAALEQVLSASDDPAVLAAPFQAAYSAGRDDDFYAAMKSRPAPPRSFARRRL